MLWIEIFLTSSFSTGNYTCIFLSDIPLPGAFLHHVHGVICCLTDVRSSSNGSGEGPIQTGKKDLNQEVSVMWTRVDFYAIYCDLTLNIDTIGMDWYCWNENSKNFKARKLVVSVILGVLTSTVLKIIALLVSPCIDFSKVCYQTFTFHRWCTASVWIIYLTKWLLFR